MPGHEANQHKASKTHDAAVGRWRTLKDAARLLHMPQNTLLKSLKRGQIRGTQIGNNWFAYVDAEMVEAAAEKARRREQKQESRRQTLAKLKAENQALKDDMKRLKEGAETVADPALVDASDSSLPASRSEVSYLRAELRAMREQHAEEMRRKDILLRQSYQLLQGVVQSGALTHQQSEGAQQQELERLRREQQQSAKLMGDMSDMLALMYRRLRQAEASDGQ